MANIYGLLQEKFAAGEDFILSEEGDCLYTYQDLHRQSARCAHRLRALGVQPNDTVMVQVDKSPANLLLYFGCLRAGAIYLPLNTAYTEDELRYFIANAQPRLIVCDPLRQDFFVNEAGGAPVQTLDSQGEGSFTANLGSEASFNTVPRQAADTAVILYTSGTTGRPKGAMISHGNLAHNALALHQAWQWQAGDVMLHALPLFHVHGLFVAIHPAALNASPIILLPAFNPQAVLDNLPRATVYMGVPTNYTRLLATGKLNRQACRNMRLFTSGSAPLLPQTFEAFRQATGQEIVERYGMTETGMNTSNPLDGERKPGTVGTALPGVALKIVGDDLAPLPPGETGKLLVKGDNVFSGYWQLPEKTAEEFTQDGYFKTGDLASMDEDGYLSIVGRSKDLIISGGLNVYPKEIETVLDRLPGVVESAVIGLPHQDFGEGVCAIIVPAADAQLTGESVLAQLKQKLANFKLPKWVFFMEQLPRNAMGKVQKNLLRDQYSARVAG